MAKKDTFEKMYELYNAIIDIDKIINSPKEKDQNGDTKLDQVLFCVRDIPKDEYNPEYANQIILNIRAAIVEMYNKVSSEINEDIVKGQESKLGNIQKSTNNPNIEPVKSPITRHGLGNQNINPNMNIPSFLSRYDQSSKPPVIGSQVIATEKSARDRINYGERGTVYARQSD